MRSKDEGRGASLFSGGVPLGLSLHVATRYRCSLEIKRPISDLHPESPTKAAPRSRQGNSLPAPPTFLSSFEVECGASYSSRGPYPRDEGIGVEV
jgi:hypothetical protein